MSTEKTTQILSRIISGDLALFSDDFKYALREKISKDLTFPKMILTKETVLKVLDGFQRGEYTPDIVQAWASFMKRGYVGSGISEPIKPIEIEYADVSEDLIAEVLSRLDEIGDVIDGEIKPEEIREWQRLLSED